MTEFTALLMLFFQYRLLHMAVAVLAMTTKQQNNNNNGPQTTQDWKEREGRDEEEASTIWYGR